MSKRDSKGRETRKEGMDRRSFIKGSAALAAGLMASGIPRKAQAQPHPLIVDAYNVPVPDFTDTNLHPGVEVLLRRLACEGVPFYRADASYEMSDPAIGLIASNDVVLIKVNGQWQYRGVTNSDVVRGVVERVLHHPEGFTGEVVIFENGQGQGSLNCDKSWPGRYPDLECHANAEDESHSFQYLIDNVFSPLGDTVSGYLLDPIRNTEIASDDHVTDGYRRESMVSYPCFTTARGTRVELKEGIWNGAGYGQNLKLINIPVFKHHGGSAVTGALKHMYGVLSMRWSAGYHYGDIGNATGEMHTVVRTPVVNIIDCIWVSPGDLAGYPESETVRTNRLLAGFDPVALDYYAGKEILYPAGNDPYHHPDLSGDFQACLTQARDRINANGGIRGEEVTFDDTLFNVVRADCSAAQAPISLRLVKRTGETRLEWTGGAPPYRIWRSETRDFSNPDLLSECCWETFFVDVGAAGDGRLHFYLVE